MLRTYQYLLRPTAEQEVALDFLLWQGRKVWNEALQQRIEAYEQHGQTFTSMDQFPYFRDLRHANPDTLGKLNATCMNKVLRRLDKAFQAFFRRVKAGKKLGFPKFKDRKRFNSLELKYGNGCKLWMNEGRITFYVMNVGEMRMSYHRPVPEEAKIKMAVIKRVAGRWYSNLQIELPDPVIERIPTGESVGIDPGLLSLVALSNGVTVEHPRYLKESLAKLRRLQRKAARQVKGSNRQKQTYQQIAKLNHHVANQRRDFWHKLTRDLAERYDLIAVEDLRVAFMNQSKYLSRSSYDAGLGMLKPMLAYKVEETGAKLILVNPKNTTQTCSGCGEKVKKSLRVRIHDCPSCGLKIDRDVNAARNVLAFAGD